MEIRKEATMVTRHLEDATASQRRETHAHPFAPGDGARAVVVEDFAPGLERAFPAEFAECDSVLHATGCLPDFVRGTYYLNGPARFGRGDLVYQHWLDGDGMVCALRFAKDGIHFKQRYVRSRKLEEEQSSGEPLFRTFGTAFPGSRLNRVNNALESPVNVSVYPFEKRLLAFGEQGLPWELDPDTLETRRQFDFNGRLNDASPFSAHPKFDPASGEMFNFGVFFSPHNPRLYFYGFGPEGMRYRKAVPLTHPCSVHDFSISKNYAVVYLSPYLLDVSGVVQDGRSVMDCLRWEPEQGSRLLVLSRRSGEVVVSIPAGHRYCLHLINCFESGERLTVDVLEFDEPLYRHYQPVPNLFHDVSRGGPVRFVIDLHSHEIAERVAVDYDKSPDFPAIDPRRNMHSYEDFWMLAISAAGHRGRKFFDQLVHANWNAGGASDIYQSPPGCYLGAEPVFAGDSCSEQAVVICQEFNARTCKSSFLFFDAYNVRSGPLATIALEEACYLGFHAIFQPEG